MAISFSVDGIHIQGEAGETILMAAERAGIYIPRLCAHKRLEPHGSCRVCMVLVNGRPQPACIQPISEGAVVENQTPELTAMRRQIVEMLFVEGNHYCMFCERSGGCELQAMGYRLGMMHPRYPFFYPARPVDASHPEVVLDHNRCILCARCVRGSLHLDHKHVYDFASRGLEKHIAVNSSHGLAGTDTARDDQAVALCPVGALMRKRVGYAVPIGQRPFDHQPMGADIEAGRRGGMR